MLILPVQRITRYVLLIQQALKNSEKSSDDYNLLITANERMKSICKDIDEGKNGLLKYRSLINISAYQQQY